jgi:hypothetical protein
MRIALALLLLAVGARAQTITADAVSIPVGGTAAVSFTMDTAGASVYGWSFGVCHDPGLTLLTAISPVDVLTAFYLDVNLFPDGFTHGAVWDLAGAPYAGGVLVNATYQGGGAIVFCDQALGSPPVDNLVSDGIGVVIPTLWVDGGVTEIHADYVRGDCVPSGVVNIMDVIGVLNWALLFGPQPCADACDSNGDGTLDVSDAIYLLTYLFDLGPQPPVPWAACGSSVALGCAASACP